jgi:hypothetical protein
MRLARFFALLAITAVFGVPHTMGASPPGAGPEAREPGPDLPKILDLSPSPAHPNQTVTVRGKNLLPDPKVLVNDQPVPVEKADAKRLTFRVPAGLPLDGCQASSQQVVIQTARGSSTPATLLVRAAGPKLDHPKDEIRRGRAIELTGSRFLGGSPPSAVTFTLGSATLTMKRFSDSQATVIIPKDHPLGPTALAVTNDCGRDEAYVKVMDAPPEILSVDPTNSVAPTGILEVATDVTDASLISSAQLGAEVFPATDPTLFRTVPKKDPLANVVVALRIPETLKPGWFELRLTGPGGTGDKALVKVSVPHKPMPRAPVRTCEAQPVAMSAFSPLATGEIAYPPPSAANDETFPMGENPFNSLILLSCNHDDAARAEWAYRLKRTCPGTDGQPGTVTGHEIHCSKEEGCDKDIRFLPKQICQDDYAEERGPYLKCFELHGNYRLDSKTNIMELWIDRKSPAGPERYVGGWGLSQKMDTPAMNFEIPAYLILRSDRTGMQISLAFPFLEGPPVCSN